MKSYQELMEIYLKNTPPKAIHWLPAQFRYKRKFYIFQISRIMLIMLFSFQLIVSIFARDNSLGNVLFTAVTLIVIVLNSSVNRRNFSILLFMLILLTFRVIPA